MRERDDLLLALSIDGVGDREEVLLRALAFLDLVVREIGHMGAHDGVDVGAHVFAAPADHLDGVGRRELQQFLCSVEFRLPRRPRELALVRLEGIVEPAPHGPGFAIAHRFAVERGDWLYLARGRA